jgi:hypothetical protein
MRPRLTVVVLFVFAVATSALAEARAPQMFYIPVMGQATSDAVNYITQLRVTNHLARKQFVRVDWIARDGAGSKEGALVMQLGPTVTQLMTGIANIAGPGYSFGAARFVAVNEDGTLDPDASISGEALLIGLRRSDGARLTQSIRGIPLTEMRADDLDGEGIVFYPVPRQTMRANYGIVNDAEVPNVFEIEARSLFLHDGGSTTWRETVLVPANAMVQRSLDPNLPADDDSLIVTIRRLGQGGGTWTAYVSSIDRITSDGVLVSPLPKNGHLNP